jgi:DNA-binding transcriptional LysR family regulator
MDRKLRKLHSPSLVCFIAVVSEGSFRGAARKLNTAPSAVNRRVLEIERELGVPLFDRHGRTMKLASAGEILLKHCKNTMHSLEDAMEALGALKQLRTGIVRVAAAESFAADVVPLVTTQFSTNYPGITVQCSVDSSSGIVRSIENDDVDVGFTFGQFDSPKLRIIAKLELSIGAVVGPKHPLAKRKFLSVRECFEHPVVVPQSGLSFRKRLDRVTRRFIEMNEGGIIASSPRIMVGVARRNSHIVFQTRIGLADDLKTGQLVFIPINDRLLGAVSCAVVASYRSLGRFAVERFCKMAQAALKSMHKLSEI